MYKQLMKHQEEGKSILIGSNGAGWMGTGFLSAVKNVPAMEVAVVSDSDGNAAYAAFLESGIPESNIVITDNVSTAEDAVRAGKKVATGDITLASKIDAIDIVTDVTPSPASGAEVAYAGIGHGKRVVLINIEADVTVGPGLKKLAREKDGFYSVSSGDEPGCITELWDFVNCLGYEPIVIGKGKNNPMNPEANPDTVRESALKTDKDPYQVASYVDGTKTMFEMSSIANAVGCRPMQPGMVGPDADLSTISGIFALEEDGGITKFPGAVDFVQGSAMAGGVFVTVRIREQRIQDDLNYLKVGKGKYFTFFRPYHLWFLEAPISFARAYFNGETTLVPLDEPVADVMTIAKKDLAGGEVLDDFGGYMYFGRMDIKDHARAANALPVGLAPGAVLKNPKKKGEVITWDDVDLDEDSVVVRLRREQDK